MNVSDGLKGAWADVVTSAQAKDGFQCDLWKYVYRFVFSRLIMVNHVSGIPVAKARSLGRLQRISDIAI